MPPLDLYDVGFVGVAGASGVSPDFESNYDNASDWTQVSTGINVDSTVNDACACRIGGGEERNVHQALGLTLDNNAWVARTIFNEVSAPTGNTSSFPFQICDASGQYDAVDMIGMGEQLTNPTAYLNSNEVGGSFRQFAYGSDFSIATAYYSQLTRTTSTSTKLNIFTSSDWTSELDTELTDVISSGINNLDVIYHGDNDGENESSHRNWDITYTAIWDGVTTPP